MYSKEVLTTMTVLHLPTLAATSGTHFSGNISTLCISPLALSRQLFNRGGGVKDSEKIVNHKNANFVS